MEPVVLRTSSAHNRHATVTAPQRAGADVSIISRQGPAMKRAIGTTGDNARTKTQYTNAIYDHDRDTSISDAC